jgi:hypothetical protein
MEAASQLALQIRVSRMLGYGFVLSLALLGGVGSLIAVVLGLKARHIIKSSDVKIVGIRMAWWCMLAGALGTGIELSYWLQFAFSMMRTK